MRVHSAITVSVSLILLALFFSSLKMQCLHENLFCSLECSLTCNFVPGKAILSGFFCFDRRFIDLSELLMVCSHANLFL